MADSNREIERKFLLDEPPEGLDDHPGTKIRQGYIAITEVGTEVRIRKEGKRHSLTIKEGHGRVRGQEEVKITPPQFASLWPLTGGKRIRKVRYEVPHDELVIQVDVYRHKLKGLLTAEVAFPEEDVAHRFHALAWLGQEVIGDGHFSNHNLARQGMPHSVRAADGRTSGDRGDGRGVGDGVPTRGG